MAKAMLSITAGTTVGGFKVYIHSQGGKNTKQQIVSVKNLLD